MSFTFIKKGLHQLRGKHTQNNKRTKTSSGFSGLRIHIPFIILPIYQDVSDILWHVGETSRASGHGAKIRVGFPRVEMVIQSSELENFKGLTENFVM